MNKSENTRSQFRQEVTIDPRSSFKIEFASPYPVKVTGISISKAEARYLEIDQVVLGTTILQQSQRGLTFADDVVRPSPIDSLSGKQTLVILPGMIMTVSITNWRKTKPVSFWIRLDVIPMNLEVEESRSSQYKGNRGNYQTLMDTKYLLQSVYNDIGVNEKYKLQEVLDKLLTSISNIETLIIVAKGTT